MTPLTGWQAVVEILKAENVKYLFGMPTSSADLYDVQPDFVGMAHAYQCYGEKVTEPSQVIPALERAMQANARGESAILDIVIDPDDFSEGFRAFYK
jgi:thiamine pyrophosphate-dependent acetolactate synthase large subunit-like protein